MSEQQEHSKSELTKSIDRLKALLLRIESVVQEDWNSVVSLGVTPAVSMAKEELEKLQRQTARGDQG